MFSLSFLLDPTELIGAKSIYIITDVMKASMISGVVMGDDDSWERVSINSRPIGFRYSKFRLTSDGLVAEQVCNYVLSYACANLQKI